MREFQEKRPGHVEMNPHRVKIELSFFFFSLLLKKRTNITGNDRRSCPCSNMSSRDGDEGLCDKHECYDLYTWAHTLNYICWQYIQVLAYCHTLLNPLMRQTRMEWLIFLLCNLMENAGRVGTSSLFLVSIILFTSLNSQPFYSDAVWK